MTKQAAYQWLANTVQAPMSHAHIGHLGEYYCRVVIEESEKLLARRTSGRAETGRLKGGICMRPLTDAERARVEENMGLVGRVIKDCVHRSEERRVGKEC